MLIYQVFYFEPGAGEFLQASFSTPDLACAWLEKQEPAFQEECYIDSCELDSQ